MLHKTNSKLQKIFYNFDGKQHFLCCFFGTGHGFDAQPVFRIKAFKCQDNLTNAILDDNG